MGRFFVHGKSVAVFFYGACGKAGEAICLSGHTKHVHSGRVKVVEEKEYFSGSLIETKKEEFPALKRCSSYNADRTTELEVKEMEGVKAKCIPRKPKTSQSSTRKEGNVNEVPCIVVVVLVLIVVIGIIIMVAARNKWSNLIPRLPSLSLFLVITLNLSQPNKT